MSWQYTFDLGDEINKQHMNKKKSLGGNVKERC